MSDAPWRLGGRFDLLGPLGTGAAGTVWRGREVSDGTEHAVKLLRPELVSDGAAVTQLYATLNSIAQLAHPGITAVDDAVSADGWLALRSRLVHGESLRTLLSRQGAMPPAQAAVLIGHVCDTLAAAHAAGIAHGDLHPANVLLGASSSAAPTVVLPNAASIPPPPPAASPAAPIDATITDFGMAGLVNRAAAQGAPTAGAAHAAPPAEYRAPELNPAQSDSAPADVYAIGVILYECLAGRPPFIAQWPDAIAQMHRQTPPPPIPATTDSLWRIVDACLQKDPRYRPTAAQLAAALRNEAAAASDVAQTMVFSAYPGDNAQDQPQPRATSAVAASAAAPGPGNFRLPRVITNHKTESGIAAAVVVVGLLIGVALSMAGGSSNGSNNGSPNAANAGQATSAPSTATTSDTPQAVVLPSASPSPSPSSSPSPSASAPATGNAVFVNVLSNRCMDTAGRQFANGTTEDIYDCNGTPAQALTVTASGQLTEDGGAFCLDDFDFGNTPGAKVGIWSCNGGSNQQWTLRSDGSIVSNSANLCLDVDGQGSDNFTPLVLQTCDGGPSQQWTRQ